MVGFHGDERLTLSRLTLAERQSLSSLREVEAIAELEREFSASHPRVAQVHLLQAIATAPAHQTVTIERNGRSMMCSGMGLLPWFPSAEILKVLGLVEGVLVRQDHLLPEITSSFYSTVSPAASSGGNPEASCV